MLHLFNVNVAGVARVTEVCGVLRPGNTGGKVGCDWWRAGHVTSCSPLIGQVVNISSLMGSVQTTLDRRATYGATYRCSKAAQVTAVRGECVGGRTVVGNIVLQTIHRFHNRFSQSQRRPLLGVSKFNVYFPWVNTV